MACRPLKVTLYSASGLKNVNRCSKMDVYAVVSVAGDPLNRKQKTKQEDQDPRRQDGGTNPEWNSYPIVFTLDEDALLHKPLTLNIKLVSKRTLGDIKICKVKIPLKELLDSMGGGDAQKKQIKHVSYSVPSSSGKPNGTINFGYEFGDKFSVPEPQKKSHDHEPVMAYPVGHPGSSSGYPPAGYPPAQAPGAYSHDHEPVMAHPVGHPGSSSGYPPAQGYPYPPPGAYSHDHEPVIVAYPVGHPGSSSGYPPAQGYPYPPPGAYPPPPHQQPGYGYPPPKPGGNMALGLGAGLLGRLLIGDVVHDVGEMAAYGAGFGGDDFGGGFDF